MSTTTRYQPSRQPLREYLSLTRSSVTSDSSYIGRGRGDVMALTQTALPLDELEIPTGQRQELLRALLKNNDYQISQHSESARHAVLDADAPGGRDHKDDHSPTLAGILVGFVISFLAFIGLPILHFFNVLTSSYATLGFLMISVPLSAPLIMPIVFNLIANPFTDRSHSKAIAAFGAPIGATARMLAQSVEALSLPQKSPTSALLRKLHTQLAGLDRQTDSHGVLQRYRTEMTALWSSYMELTAALETFGHTVHIPTQEEEDATVLKRVQDILDDCRTLATTLGEYDLTGIHPDAPATHRDNAVVMERLRAKSQAPDTPDKDNAAGTASTHALLDQRRRQWVHARKQWGRIQELHREVEQKFLDSQTQWETVIERPAMTDVTVETTAAMIEAYTQLRHTDDTRPDWLDESAIDFHTEIPEIADEPYYLRVTTFSRAYQAADAYARRVGTSLVPDEERRTLERVAKLIERASHPRTPQAERQSSYARAIEMLRDLTYVHVPERAMIALHERARLALTAPEQD